MSDDLVSRATIKAQILRMGEPVAFGNNAAVIDELVAALSEARAESERLRGAAKGQLIVVNTAIAERKRAERNRDMWEGQCERQAARLELLHAAIKRQVDNIERWRETDEPASPEESKSIYEQLVTALKGDRHD